MRYILASALLFFASAAVADAAALYLDPESGSYGPGDTFIVRVRLDNSDVCVNATHVEIKYPPNLMRAVDFSRGGSILSLWVEEPKIDTEKGTVTFSGGIPGGYCGRISGDPVQSNILGKVVFTILQGSAQEAIVTITDQSKVLLNDGFGTQAPLVTKGAIFTIVDHPTLRDNQWLTEVHDDTIPPDAFEVQVDSTRGVFGGKYYIVFSTVDKQSGLDHYEIYERGAWKTVTSPYQLRDQSLRNPLQVRAIDKAGNERLGTYIEGSAPERQAPPYEYLTIAGILALFMLGVAYEIYRKRRRAEASPPPATPPIAGA